MPLPNVRCRFRAAAPRAARNYFESLESRRLLAVTATIATVSPNPSSEALPSVTIKFSEPVSGFDLSDLHLSRDGGAIPLIGAALATTNNSAWTLSGLNPLTSRAGSYLLSLTAAGSGIQSTTTGAPLSADADGTWKMNAILGTSASDTITLARESTGGVYDVFVNNEGSTPDYSVNVAQLGSALQVSGVDGRDMLNFTGQAGDSYTFAPGRITRAGTNETITYTAPVKVLSLNTGTFTVTSDLIDPDGFDLLTFGSSTQVILNTTQHLDVLDVGDGSTVRFAPGGGKVLVTDGLAVEGSLDLTDNDLLLQYASGQSSPLGRYTVLGYDGVLGMLQQGRNGGNWDGATGIRSSVANARTTGLAAAEAGSVLGLTDGQTGMWDGEVVTAPAVLVKFTYVGDANLDGKVNIDDYGRIDANVGQSGTVFGWYNGDFNLDGKINIDDYGLIDGIMGAQGPVL
jgi:hypothetical protein